MDFDEYDPADPTEYVISLHTLLLPLHTVDIFSEIVVDSKPVVLELQSIPLPSSGNKKSKKSSSLNISHVQNIPLPSAVGPLDSSQKNVNVLQIPLPSSSFNSSSNRPPPPPIFTNISTNISLATTSFSSSYLSSQSVPNNSGPVKFSIKNPPITSAADGSVSESIWNSEPTAPKLGPLPKRSKPTVLPTGLITGRRRFTDTPVGNGTTASTNSDMSSSSATAVTVSTSVSHSVGEKTSTKLASASDSIGGGTASSMSSEPLKTELFLPSKSDLLELGGLKPEPLFPPGSMTSFTSMSNNSVSSLLGNTPTPISALSALFNVAAVAAATSQSSINTSLYTPPPNKPLQLPNPIHSLSTLANYPTLNMPYLNPQKLRSAQMISQPLVENPAWAEATKKEQEKTAAAIANRRSKSPRRSRSRSTKRRKKRHSSDSSSRSSSSSSSRSRRKRRSGRRRTRSRSGGRRKRSVRSRSKKRYSERDRKNKKRRSKSLTPRKSRNKERRSSHRNDSRRGRSRSRSRSFRRKDRKSRKLKEEPRDKHKRSPTPKRRRSSREGSRDRKAVKPPTTDRSSAAKGTKNGTITKTCANPEVTSTTSVQRDSSKSSEEVKSPITTFVAADSTTVPSEMDCHDNSLKSSHPNVNSYDEKAVETPPAPEVQRKSPKKRGRRSRSPSLKRNHHHRRRSPSTSDEEEKGAKRRDNASSPNETTSTKYRRLRNSNRSTDQGGNRQTTPQKNTDNLSRTSEHDLDDDDKNHLAATIVQVCQVWRFTVCY